MANHTQSERGDMRLYDIPKGSKILVEVIDSKGNTKEDTVTFHRLDGMYSYCETSDGEPVHLSVVTPLIKDGEYYRIEEES